MLTDTVRVSVNSNIFVFFLTKVFAFMYRKVKKTENEIAQNVDVGSAEGTVYIKFSTFVLYGVKYGGQH